MKPRVVQFGAGGIGRGFMGHLFTAAGYEVLFVEVDRERVAALRARREYPLRLVGPARRETLVVRPVDAVDARDREEVAREVAACAFACTAVGTGNLPALVPALAEGCRRRSGPLDILLCENQLHCGLMLRNLLRSELSPEELARVGCVESVVSRMVPVPDPQVTACDPLLVVAEDYPVLPVDAGGFVGPPPEVPGLRPVANFPAWVERKLFVHNLGHAVAAYRGFLRGYRYLAEVMADPDLRAAVVGAMDESGEALARRHGLSRAETGSMRDDLARRFANPELRDTVSRVGRDPVRKLRPDDRLIGAALACLAHGVEPREIAAGVAAAFRFDPGDDPSAERIRAAVCAGGFQAAFREFTGQQPEGDLGRRVLAAWRELGGSEPEPGETDQMLG